MSGKGAKKTSKKKGANGYKLPDPIPAGEVLTDITKKQWVIGPSIGVGGFGEIYSAAPYTGKTPKSYPYVIKIEPHENGPLFVEMHFYMRNAKSSDVASWKTERKLTFLGMPSFIGSGRHNCRGTKYRFVVMERFGKNLWDLFMENNRKFPEHTVYKIAIQILNVLEYIHNKTYVHADIKGANLLQSLNSPDQIYLVDFGLASHYTNKTEYKSDLKKSHNGTIEYTSRDMHIGIPTMRGDLEILGYNMIQWLCGSLPWENNLTDQSSVQRQKEKAFENIPQFLKKCFPDAVPEPIKKFMTLLNEVKFNETPNYVKFKDFLVKGLLDIGHKPEGKLEFSNSVKFQKVSATPVKSKNLRTEKTRKSPRLQNIRSPSPQSSPPSSLLNDSDLGSVIIRKDKEASDKPRIIKNFEITDDSDMDIEIKFKRKRKNKKDENMEFDIKDVKKKLPKRTAQKSTKSYDLDETVSDDQIQGMKSGPRAIIKRKKKPVQQKRSIDENNDSEKDMFDDNDSDYDDHNTTPVKIAKSWRDCPTVKNSNVKKPGEYNKRVIQNKNTNTKKR